MADLVKTHVLTHEDVIDAQPSGNMVQAYTALRAAAGHMAMIANPLFDAIVSPSVLTLTCTSRPGYTRGRRQGAGARGQYAFP